MVILPPNMLCYTLPTKEKSPPVAVAIHLQVAMRTQQAPLFIQQNPFHRSEDNKAQTGKQLASKEQVTGFSLISFMGGKDLMV